jgi:hypothetical protein
MAFIIGQTFVVVCMPLDGAAGVPLKQGEGAEQARQNHWVDAGLGARILRDLRATRIRTLAARTQ